MHLRTYYPTVVLSDIHLGTSHSKTIEVSNFLKSVNCDRLILNGDIIDGWHLRKAGTKRWQAKHTDFFKVIMKMMENFGTEVIYVRGNHDDFLDSLVTKLDYDAKRASFQKASSQMQRAEKLLAKNAISMQEFETTQASYTNAKSAFENAQNTLNDTKLRAPFDGFIQKKYVENYQRVQPGQGSVTSLSRWASPPESVLEACPSVR